MGEWFWRRDTRRVVIGMMLVSVLWLVTYALHRPGGSAADLHRAPVDIATAVGFCLVVLAEPVFARTTPGSSAGWGDVSYSLYLTHPLIAPLAPALVSWLVARAMLPDLGVGSPRYDRDLRVDGARASPRVPREPVVRGSGDARPCSASSTFRGTATVELRFRVAPVVSRRAMESSETGLPWATSHSRTSTAPPSTCTACSRTLPRPLRRWRPSGGPTPASHCGGQSRSADVPSRPTTTTPRSPTTARPTRSCCTQRSSSATTRCSTPPTGSGAGGTTRA